MNGIPVAGAETGKDGSQPAVVPKFITELLQDPNGLKADEIAVVAVGIGVLFVLTLVIFLGLEIYDVMGRDHPWSPVDFANAAAVIFGSAGGVLAAVTVAMGIKAKCGG